MRGGLGSVGRPLDLGKQDGSYTPENSFHLQKYVFERWLFVCW